MGFRYHLFVACAHQTVQGKGDLGRIKISDSCWLLSLLDVSSSSFVLHGENSSPRGEVFKGIGQKGTEKYDFLQSLRGKWKNFVLAKMLLTLEFSLFL